MVCGTILLNVVDFLLHHVACVEIAKDAWDKFYATFEKKRVGNRLQLHQQFYNLNMEEGTLMQAHIDKFRMIANQLANIDHQVSDENLAFTFGESLPLSFHTFVISLSIHIDQLSTELVCGQLLQEEL